MLVSIIIPNWNGLHFLEVCFTSLFAQTYDPFEVIVVDNDSEDGSQAYIREQWPAVRLIALEENRGFTGACNIGMEAAQGEIIVLLNNDTEVEPDWLAEVMAAFDRHPEAGMIASKMLLFDQRNKLHTAGDFYRKDGIPGNRGVRQLDGPEYNQECYVFSACGGSAAYRRTMLDEIGLLDDDFFFSGEDVDLGWRAQLAGWRCVYTPHAVVYHYLSASGGGVTASYYTARNMLWIVVKNYPADLLWRYWLLLLRAQGHRALQALRTLRGPASRATLRGMIAGVLTLGKALRKRRRVQNLREESTAYLDSILREP